MTIQIVFETHSTSEDNECGIATGWLDGRLSPLGRSQSQELGERRRNDNITAVFTSDLGRAVETATLAFGDTSIPILLDWRLRECDYGTLNGAPNAQVHDRRMHYLDTPHPGGESWRQAVARVGRFLSDPALRRQGQRVVVIGHAATRFALAHRLGHHPLEELLEAKFVWQPGWEYTLE